LVRRFAEIAGGIEGQSLYEENPGDDLGGFDSYEIDYIYDFRYSENRRISLILNGGGERIRTSDPLVPNQVRRIIEIY